MTAAALPRGTTATGIPLELIDVADNVRSSMDEAGLEALAASIQASGLLQPITVDYELVSEIAGQIGNYDAPPLGRVEVAA